MANKIKKGDIVRIMSGKDKGKEEKVLAVYPKDAQVLIEKVNVAKRHTKPTQSNKGGIFEKALPIAWARVSVVCPACKKATRVGFTVLKDKKKVRVCKKCKENIDK